MRFKLAKAFHVSPYMPMDLDNDWRFTVPGARLVVHMENRRLGKRLFDATLALERREINGRSLATALARYPFASLKGVARIYWQALCLWAKRVPFHPHPAQPNPEKAT
jgi:DUF1365 family protein